MTFGGLAAVWAFILFIRGFLSANFSEMWTALSRFMWNVGLYIWLIGRLYDVRYPYHAVKLAPIYQEYCAKILLFAFIFQGFYHVVLHYYGFAASAKKTDEEYDQIRQGKLRGGSPYEEARLRCTFLEWYGTWRDFELLLTFCLIGKDLAAVSVPSACRRLVASASPPPFSNF
jgi:hypothetical protein